MPITTEENGKQKLYEGLWNQYPFPNNNTAESNRAWPKNEGLKQSLFVCLSQRLPSKQLPNSLVNKWARAFVQCACFWFGLHKLPHWTCLGVLPLAVPGKGIRSTFDTSCKTSLNSMRITEMKKGKKERRKEIERGAKEEEIFWICFYWS